MQQTTCGICGSNKITENKDIGCEIYGAVEERQHMQKCECGARRLHLERLEKNLTQHYYEEWYPKGAPMFPTDEPTTN